MTKERDSRIMIASACMMICTWRLKVGVHLRVFMVMLEPLARIFIDLDCVDEYSN